MGEEGGVEAEVKDKLHVQRFVYTPRGGEKTFKIVTYFLMECKKGLEGGFGEETAEVVWLPWEEARKKLLYSNEKKVLDLAKEKLESGEATLFDS